MPPAEDEDWDDLNAPEDHVAPASNPAKNVLLIILCIGGVCGLLCCGVLGFVAYRLKNSFVITKDAGEVNARTQEMATITVPDRFKPEAAMTFNLGIKLGMVVYQTEGVEKGSLLLIDLPISVEEARLRAREEMKNAQAGRRKKPGNPDVPAEQPVEHEHADEHDPDGHKDEAEPGEEIRDLEITESSEKEREIRGLKVPVRYETGMDRKTNKEFKQLSVSFPGTDAKSSVTLVIQLPKEDWDDAEIEKTLDSIR